MVWSEVVLSELNEDGTLKSQFQYKIVPDDQADASKAWYGESLPASQALLGRSSADEVNTTIDGRPVRLRVQAISQVENY